MFRRFLTQNSGRKLRNHQNLTHRFQFARLESSSSTQASRIDRITSRLPKRLQKYTRGLRNAPVSHIISFMILHEITAIVPVFGLFALFHYTAYAPIEYMTGHFGDYVQTGVSRFEKYFTKKGWFGFGSVDGARNNGSELPVATHDTHEVMQRVAGGDPKYKILMEVALAYAITKAILPLRIIGSVWATPWFAGVLLRAKGVFKRKTWLSISHT